MTSQGSRRCTAFEGTRKVASGELVEVALRVKEVVDRGEIGPILVFDDQTSEQVELDLRGTAEEVAARVAPVEEARARRERGPGRPKLGVVAREVTLLPRHWEWLNEQPGGASVALRKLVEEARKTRRGADRLRGAQESTYRFLSAMAGNLPGFEESARALFAIDETRFEDCARDWPEDVRQHALHLMHSVLEASRDQLAEQHAAS